MSQYKTVSVLGNKWDVAFDFSRAGEVEIEGIFVAGNSTTDLTDLLAPKVVDRIEDAFRLSLVKPMQTDWRNEAIAA